MKKIRHTLSYHKNHHDPSCFREGTIDLCGPWKFKFDKKDEGLLNHFEKGLDEATIINVPYPYQAKASFINKVDEHIDVMWYEKDLHVNKIHKHMILTFYAVDYKSTLFINDKYVGVHEGGYDHFSYDIAPFIKVGHNKIVMRVEDYHHIDQIRGKQRWQDESFECFYLDTSGITLPVVLDCYDDEYISFFSLRGDYLNKVCRTYFEISNDEQFEIEVDIYDKDGHLVTPILNSKIEGKAHFDIDVNDIASWSHECPTLYDVKIFLKRNDVVIDEILSYVGFVNYESKGERIYINDKDTYLKLVLDQGYFPQTMTTPSEAQIIEDLELILKAGFNGLRKHEKIESPLYYYYLDLYGLYSWQECPSPMAFSSCSKRNIESQFTRIVKQHMSHPSIMTYVIYNESWGINAISRNREIELHAIEMYEKIKSIVPDRFVISNDGWEHTKSDLITFHNYLENEHEMYEYFPKGVLNIIDNSKPFATQDKRMFVGENNKYGGEPIILSEFAGIAFADSSTSDWGYGDKVSGEEAFISRYESLLNFLLKEKHIRGFCATQLSDVESEKNGFYTFDRKQKIDIDKIAALHKQFK